MFVFCRTASVAEARPGPHWCNVGAQYGLHQHLLDQRGSLKHVHSLAHFKAFRVFFHCFLGYFPCRFEARF